MIDKASFAKIMAGLRLAYPRFKIAESVEAIELWHRKLKMYDQEVLTEAVSHWIDTEAFPPSIADIKRLCEPKESPNESGDWGSAWENALRVVKHYGYYRQSEALEELRAKDPKACEVLRRLGYQTVCMSENLPQERANFRMIYESSLKYEARVKEYESLPKALKSKGLFKDRMDRLLTEFGN